MNIFYLSMSIAFVLYPELMAIFSVLPFTKNTATAIFVYYLDQE